MVDQCTGEGCEASRANLAEALYNIGNNPSIQNDYTKAVLFIEGFLLGQILELIFFAVLLYVCLFRRSKQTQVRRAGRGKYRTGLATSALPSERPPRKEIPYDLGSHPPESCNWLNMLVSQIFMEMRSSLSFQKMLVEEITEAANNLQDDKIAQLGAINIENFSFGKSAPVINDITLCILPTASMVNSRNTKESPDRSQWNKPTENGDATSEPKNSDQGVNGASTPRYTHDDVEVNAVVDMEYHGEFTIEISTEVKVDWPAPGAISLPVKMKVVLQDFWGSLRINMPQVGRAGRERLTVGLGFEQSPDINMKIQSSLGHRTQVNDLPKLEELVLSAVRDGIENALVLPNEYCLVLDFDMLREERQRQRTGDKTPTDVDKEHWERLMNVSPFKHYANHMLQRNSVSRHSASVPNSPVRHSKRQHNMHGHHTRHHYDPTPHQQSSRHHHHSPAPLNNEDHGGPSPGHHKLEERFTGLTQGLSSAASSSTSVSAEAGRGRLERSISTQSFHSIDPHDPVRPRAVRRRFLASPRTHYSGAVSVTGSHYSQSILSRSAMSTPRNVRGPNYRFDLKDVDMKGKRPAPIPDIEASTSTAAGSTGSAAQVNPVLISPRQKSTRSSAHNISAQSMPQLG